MICVFTSCSASKDDSTPIPPDSKTILPSDYLDDEMLLNRLESTRTQIFQDYRANIGNRRTYAFDLYVKAGNAYRDIRRANFAQVKMLLKSSDKIQWFFLSGEYGIIHALEPAVKYQATFNRTIAYQKNIPFTGTLWKGVLPLIIDDVVSQLDPEWVFVFGSRD